MAANPNTFDHWRGGVLFPTGSGQSSTTTFDHWRGGVLFPSAVTVSAGGAITLTGDQARALARAYDAILVGAVVYLTGDQARASARAYDALLVLSLPGDVVRPGFEQLLVWFQQPRGVVWTQEPQRLSAVSAPRQLTVQWSP
jgi:hypothetical protein